MKVDGQALDPRRWFVKWLRNAACVEFYNRFGGAQDLSTCSGFARMRHD